MDGGASSQTALIPAEQSAGTNTRSGSKNKSRKRNKQKNDRK